MTAGREDPFGIPEPPTPGRAGKENAWPNWKRAPRTSRGDSRDNNLIEKIGSLQNLKEFAELHWTGTFEEYLDVVRKNPSVTRSAYQRVYDMILSYGQEEYIDNKKRLVRYNFFKDEQHGGRDAIFGLDIPLMRLVNVLQERGPALRHRAARDPAARPGRQLEGTIARLLKKGLEEYSRTPEGALYTYDWMLPEELQHDRRRRTSTSSARCTRSRCT